MGQAGGKLKARERIPAQVERLQMNQIRRQHKVGQLIETKMKRDQIGQSGRQDEAGESIAGKAETRQVIQVRRQREIRELVLTEIEIIESRHYGRAGGVSGSGS